MGRVDEVLVLDVSLVPSNPALDEQETLRVIKEAFIKRIIRLNKKCLYNDFRHSMPEYTRRKAWFDYCFAKGLLTQDDHAIMCDYFDTLYGTDGFRLVQDIEEYLIDNKGDK